MIDLPLLIQQCVPSIVQASMQAIIRVESNNNPLALNINKGYKLQFQPQSDGQANKWIKYLENNHYNFDIGLAQVNIKNIHKYGYKAIDLLDPCTNLKLGSKILVENYNNALPSSKSSDEALQKAISAYNTGNFYTGFSNGYVNKVYTYASKETLALNTNTDIPPISNNNIKPANPGVEHSAVSSTPVKTELNPYSSRSLIYIQQKKNISSELSGIRDI